MRLRRADEKEGYALGVRKMPFGGFEVMDPNEHNTVISYNNSSKAVQAIGIYVGRYDGFRVASLEVYNVQKTQAIIKQMTSSQQHDKCALC